MTLQNASHFIDSCLLCKGKISDPVIDLGESPLANNFTSSTQLDQPKYPLQIVKCLECSHLMLNYIVDPEILYSNYLFVSGTSPVTQRYFENYAYNLVQKYKIPPKTLIVDIASSDGTLLKYFQKLGCRVLGVEPAVNVAEKAIQDDIPTITKFFDLETAKEVKETHGVVQFITANNVIAHNGDLDPFFQGIAELLDKDGVFITEFSPAWMLPFKPFEIYHEHAHYHHLSSLKSYLKKFDLEITDAELVTNMGGSVRCYIEHKKYYGRRAFRKPTRSYLNLLTHSATIDDQIREINFQLETTKTKLNSLLSGFRKVAIYGCSAKLTSLLHYCTPDLSKICYGIDSSTLKQGKFIPGTVIEIKAPSFIETDPPEAILVGANNFLISIQAKHPKFKGEWLVV